MRLLVLPLATLAAAAPVAAQTLNLVAEPQTATIYRVRPQDNQLVEIGKGRAQLKLEKNDPNTVVVRQEGYRDVSRSFPKDEKYKEKLFTIALTKRVVQLSVLPYDADILVNGEPRGQRQLDVEVDEGAATTVEVTKSGFATVKRVYRWDKDGDLPVAKDRVDLVDRKVSVSAGPPGAELFVDDAKVGEGDGDVVIKRGTCAVLRVQKGGWIPVERTYCNKEGLPEPRIADRITLAGRVVTVNGPEGSRILVNQKQAGIGSFPVRVADGSCVKVEVQQVGFLSYSREYCVQDNAPEPPAEENVTLDPDDSYAASAASDQANVNVTIEVGKTRTEEQAWKLLASIVLSHFDVLENSDSQTGYLRTAWQLKTYQRKGSAAPEVVIRTRVIVKRASDDPLRYTVKIVSERNKFAGVSVKEDENFEPWDRLLNTYKDIISEMQSRLN